MLFESVYRLSRHFDLANFLLRVLYQCDISKAARIHQSVHFNHKALGVVIGSGVVIEENVGIEHHALIGLRVGGEGTSYMSQCINRSIRDDIR